MALGSSEDNKLDDPYDALQKARMQSDSESATSEEGQDEEDEDGDEDEEEDEPRLKYASLTKGQGVLYRNGDAASAFLVVGDKMIVGTHNGNIHVLSLPSLQSLRVYHAHSASITAVSVSPFPPPLPVARPEGVNRLVSDIQDSPARSPQPQRTSSPSSNNVRQQPQIPSIPANSIHIATSSIDGNVCIFPLVDPKDVLLRNFSRPVQAVALSPQYKHDRSYLSGGLAGNLVLTVGGVPGKSSVSNLSGGAAAAASGWLGTIGLGSNNGNDTILHSGEGGISAIKWSLSGKYVVWVNEQGIKIMRSNLHLEATESEFAWKRMSHIDRPNSKGWEEMAGVWKARAEWVDESGLESDEEEASLLNGSKSSDGRNPDEVLPPKHPLKQRERLVIGWGGTIWVVDVYSGGSGIGKDVGERKIGRVEIVTILRTDCIISGVSLYTPNLILVLAYLTPDETNQREATPTLGTPKKGVHRRQNALRPEIKIIDITTKMEVCTPDTLHVSRFEGLSATDYHLGVLPVARSATKVVAQRGALEVIGGGIWDAGMYPARLFNSAASVRSAGSAAEAASKAASDSVSDVTASVRAGQGPHPALLTRSMKVFIQSPYDCVLATKPTLSDHLVWLDSNAKYEEAWNLLDEHPGAARTLSGNESESSASTPTKPGQGSLMDFFAPEGASQTTSGSQNLNSQAEKEKRRIGEKWLQQLVNNGEWVQAGKIANQVLGTTASWERWIWVFVEAKKFEEITPFVPTTQLRPSLSSTVYEVILAHYISRDRQKLLELLERWSPELINVGSVITAIESKLKSKEFREDTIEHDERGRDWRALMQCLAKLYLADGRARDALKCYIQIQDADSAMFLISEYRLVDALSDDIPGLILLGITKEQQKSAPLSELEEGSREPIRLLVSEAHNGIIRPETVIKQLKARESLLPYLFFYLRALWNGDTAVSPTIRRFPAVDHLAIEGRSLVNDHADTAVSLFAEYDRPLFFIFLKSSQSYTLSTASNICEQRQYIPELVYLLAKEGRTQKALRVIIDKLSDVSQAITFCKEQEDPELWNDLLDYSMNKPSFIRGLLEEVGTAIDPIRLVRRIPEGLEIEGLRDGLSRMIREYEVQYSISEGVARVLRGEVAMGMSTLRTGQKKGVKFEVIGQDIVATNADKGGLNGPLPGHCACCGEIFIESNMRTMIGFPCGHIFHLSCLTQYDLDVPEVLKTAEVYPTPPTGIYNMAGIGIGVKIKHAKEFKEKIGTGCPLPVHKA